MFAAEYGQQKKEITEEAVKMLQKHSWPGNIRELKNVLERLVIMTPSKAINAGDMFIPESPGSDYFALNTLKDARDAFEKDFLIKKLDENAWNISKTAEAMGT